MYVNLLPTVLPVSRSQALRLGLFNAGPSDLKNIFSKVYGIARMGERRTLLDLVAQESYFRNSGAFCNINNLNDIAIRKFGTGVEK
jgi:hypothetical protein